MRRVIFFIAAVLTAAAALWSCQPEESRTSASVLKPVTIGEVVIPSSGGTSAFIYMIENPVEGGELSLEVPGDAYSHFGTLDSDTEYKPFAVGIYSETGKFATDVFFGETFRTKVMTYADVHVTFDAENYYDGTDVASMYPVYYEAVGMAVLPVSVSTQGNAVNYYYHMFEGDLSDPDYISDERITDELFPKGIENDPYYVFLGYWGETVTLLGVAEDEAGNFGPVTRQVITFDRSGVSDITGFKPESVRGAAPEKIAPEVGLYRR